MSKSNFFSISIGGALIAVAILASLYVFSKLNSPTSSPSSQLGQAAAVSAPPSPIVYHSFDDVSMNWSTFTASDQSGNNFHGTLNNMSWAANAVAGKVNQALSFDGVNDTVSLGDINVLDGVTQLTVSSWFNAKTVSSNQTSIISKELQSGNLFYGWGYQIVNGGGGNQIFFIIRNGDTPVTHSWTALNAFSTNQWYNLVLRYDGSAIGNSNRVKAYLNGVELPLTFAGTVPPVLASTDAPVLLGRAGHGLDGYFNGSIDDVRIYNRALTVTEIQNLAATVTQS
ncbi:MAG: Glycoside hydrolase family 43, partial [Parcubacteria group bacterium GW2011_GWA2_51_10]